MLIAPRDITAMPPKLQGGWGVIEKMIGEVKGRIRLEREGKKYTA